MAADEPAAGALVEPPAAATADQGVATERPGHADAAPAAAPAAATEAPGPAPRTDTYAEVAVKPEYLRVRPAPGAADGSAVGPRPPKRPHGDAAAADGDANAAGADEALEAAGNSAGAAEAGDRKRLRGQNKDRATSNVRDGMNMCSNILRGQGCSYGDKCKYSHDLPAYLAIKPPDLGDQCPLFERYGRCPIGYGCRFLKAHLNADGTLMVKEGASSYSEETRNRLERELQQKLWKRQYPFPRSDVACKELNIKVKDFGQAARKAAAPAEDGGDTNDVAINEPLRERKLIDFSNKLYLAPLTTVGNLPFRRICKLFGADITCGEMAMAENIVNGHRQEWALLRRHESEDLFGIQIAGSLPSVMTQCAELISNEVDCDFIDVNMGCPIDLVYRKGAGSALLERHSRMTQMVSGILRVSSKPLTVKMRTGVLNDKLVAHELLPQLRDLGVVAATLHGRTKQQHYYHRANWSYIDQCAQAAAPLPLFGNGDILSWEDYEANTKGGRLAGVMLARGYTDRCRSGALMKPWLFTEIKERRHWDISANERLDIFRKFCSFGLEHWGSDTEATRRSAQGINKTRRFLLEWMSFTHRYVPVGLLERVPQRMNERAPEIIGRNDLETLMASPIVDDWIKISEMLLGKAPPNFRFVPKHKANNSRSTAGEASAAAAVDDDAQG